MMLVDKTKVFRIKKQTKLLGIFIVNIEQNPLESRGCVYEYNILGINSCYNRVKYI